MSETLDRIRQLTRCAFRDTNHSPKAMSDTRERLHRIVDAEMRQVAREMARCLDRGSIVPGRDARAGYFDQLILQIEEAGA
jgi:hypothetical protein